MNYRAVLFDMDGVIVDSEPLHAEVYKQTLKKYGYDMTDEQYKRHIFGKTDEVGLRDYFDTMGIAADPLLVLADKAKAYLEYAPDKLVPYQGVIELIRDLTERGIVLALVTGSVRADAELTLRTFGIRDFFTVVVTAEDIMRSKPDPEGYLKGAAALGVSAADCVIVEDSPSGVQAAKAASMPCVAVTSGHTAEELTGATLVIDRLRPGCIDSLLGANPRLAREVLVG